MTPHLHRDPLDTLLKLAADELRASHIDDDGFTLRVMDNLPPRKKVSATLRFAIPFVTTLLAAVIAVLFTPAGSLVFDAYMDLVTETLTPTLISVALVLLTLYAASIGGALREC